MDKRSMPIRFISDYTPEGAKKHTARDVLTVCHCLSFEFIFALTLSALT